MKRRSALVQLTQVGVAGLVLGGCGFKLRGSYNYAFDSIAVMPNPGGPLGIELRRSFGDTVRVLELDAPLPQAQAVIDLSLIHISEPTRPY